MKHTAYVIAFQIFFVAAAALWSTDFTDAAVAATAFSIFNFGWMMAEKP